MRHNFHELLTEVNEAPSKAERIRMLQENNTKPLRNLLALAFDKNIELDLPEGAPPYKRDEREPVGMSSTTLMNEMRRVVRTAKTDPLNTVRKETIFIQVLEGIHFSEADVLIAAKDKELTKMFKNVTREIVNKAFPGMLTDVQPNQHSKKGENDE
jgi:hypothetical protein